MKTKNETVGKDAVTIISAGVVFEGKIKSNGNVRVDGTINGDIDAAGNVTVGESGEINGEIKAGVITVGGSINGTVESKEKVILETKSCLKGDLITKILVVEEGATFDGKSSMNGSPAAKSYSSPVENKGNEKTV